ncbi:MAG TPA: ammosamide/lymphostin RiPP family protein [Kineosporiaceae bacterium]
MDQTAPATEIAASSADTEATKTAEDFEVLDGVDFLDDIDFTLEDVESTIAPLALAHT